MSAAVLSFAGLKRKCLFRLSMKRSTLLNPRSVGPPILHPIKNCSPCSRADCLRLITDSWGNFWSTQQKDLLTPDERRGRSLGGGGKSTISTGAIYACASRVAKLRFYCSELFAVDHGSTRREMRFINNLHRLFKGCRCDSPSNGRREPQHRQTRVYTRLKYYAPSLSPAPRSLERVNSRC